ncbi:FAD-dependent monooxygenase [Nocardia vinacea]|uniref:FAD-dependent monooxygenase n=1 Tax=Nocardia vinacea TaxID=96468 RepID=A0ABZ1YZY1_9NOCA|nr:FAD-dependent monooxygenase [Nocardia vinacea]
MSLPDQNPLPTPPLRVACIGGGPGGLFTAIALAHALPGTTIDVFERNSESDVFGFGVVFSDATLDNIDAVDPVLGAALDEHGRHWDAITVHLKGAAVSAGGNGMSAVHRRILLEALRRRAIELGARLHFDTAAGPDELDAHGSYDLIVAADGTNSAVRQRFLDHLGHSVEEASVKFIWFGTTFEFDGLTFLHERSEHGNFAVHAYPIGSGLSTFIVETDETTWRSAGLDVFDAAAPGSSDLVTQRYLERLFAAHIDGHPLVANNSRWANFRTRRTDHWYTRAAHGTPVVLLGDAVHTAHFSVGSGTKMAMEDAAELARALAAHPGDLQTALARFQHIRQPQVAKIQNSSLPSLSWWDHFGRYYDAFEPWQFGFHFFSRSISAEKIRMRDSAFVAASERAWYTEHGAAPLDTPLRIGAHVLGSRLLRLTEHSSKGLLISDGAVTAWATTAEGVRDDTDSTLPLVTAPEADSITLAPEVCAALDELCARRPSAVVVHAGTALSRALVSEYVRLLQHIPTIIVERPSAIRSRRAVDERDCAATLVLSGRADAVVYEPEPQSGDRVLIETATAK